MASNDTIKKILEIEVRYESAIKQLAQYQSEIDATKARMKELRQEHKNGAIGSNEYQQSLAACTQNIKSNQAAVGVLTRQIQDQLKVEKEKVGSLNQLRAQLSAATKQYDAMSRAERESASGKALKDKINGITRELKGAEQETQRFYRNVGNYKEPVSSLEKVEGKMKDLGKAALALAGIAGFKQLVSQIEEVGSAYADQMGKVLSVTNANTIEFAAMSREVEHLGSTTRYTAQEAGEAMEYLTRNGLSAEQATASLKGVLQLAQANAIELGEAADIVTGQMNAFHLSTKDVTDINDILSYTCANSATNITQLNEALRNTAPIAYTAGVSMAETSAALGVLADNNIKGADSGTILKQTFNGLITSTAKSKKAYADLGVEMNLTTVKQDGLIGSLKKLREAGATVEQYSDIFGRRAVPGVLALINSLDQLEKKNKGIFEDAEGTAKRMFDQAYSEYTVALKGLQSAWEGLLVTIWDGTNAELRDKFVQELNDLQSTLGERAQSLAQAYNDMLVQCLDNPGDQSLQDQAESLKGQMEASAAAYTSAKTALSERMAIEKSEDEALIASWSQGADAIEQEYLPAVEAAQNALDVLYERQEENPDDASIQAEIDAKAEELRQAVTAYDTARESFNDEWITTQIESSGNEELVKTYKEAADAINTKYIPAIQQAQAAVAQAQERFNENPADEEAAQDLEAKKEELLAAESAYNDAKSELNENMMVDLADAPEGLAQMLQGPIEMLTEGIRWIRDNIGEVGKAVMAVIGAITLTKLITHVKTSAATMQTDLITAAQNASTKVNTLQDQVKAHNDQVNKLIAQQENATASERIAIENKVKVEKMQLRNAEAQLAKAKTAEIATYEQAAASGTKTGWSAAMSACGNAVKGFVNTAKTAMKGFAMMAVISLLIEGIMKLWDALNSGEGTIGKIGAVIKNFIGGAIDKLKKAIVDVINWFIDFYNNNAIVRKGIAVLGATFKSVWTVLKAGITAIGNNFKTLAEIVGTVGRALKALFTLDFSGAVSEIKKLGGIVQNFYKDQVNVAKAAAGEIADEYAEALDGADAKIERVSLDQHDSSNGGGNEDVKGEAYQTKKNKKNGGENGDDDAGGGGGGSNKGSRGGDKAARELEKQQKLEADILAAYEAEKYKILEEGAEKRRQAVESEYNKRIAKLRKTLETESNLSEEAKQALNAHILLLEQEKAQALDKLSKEEIKKVYEAQVKNNEARLALIKKQTGAALSLQVEALEKERQEEIKRMQSSVKNAEQARRAVELVNQKYDAKRLELIQQASGAELMLQISNAQKKRDVAIQAATEDIKNEEERNRRIAEIDAEYEQTRLELVANAGQTEFALRLENLDKKHELAVQAAEDEIAIEQEKLARLNEVSAEAYEAMSDEERARYDLQKQEAEQQLILKQESLALINQQYEQDQAALMQQAYDDSMNQQKAYFEQQIADLETHELERQERARLGREMDAEERALDIENKLASIGGYEAERLRIELEAAESRLASIDAMGRLAGETEEQFTQRRQQAYDASLKAKAKVDEAYVKSEQAKYQAMKSITSSLTGLLDTLGESNKGFAIMSKMIALAQIGIDTGIALAEGIKSASGVPFPGNIAAIATTVATVIANIATAIQTVKSVKLAKGGKVNGPGTGTSDSVPAMLSNGEFVMTAAATRIYEPLLMAMNNIGAGVPMQVVSSSADRDIAVNESLTESFSEAAKQIQPVVSVVEINETQDRIKMIEERATI